MSANEPGAERPQKDRSAEEKIRREAEQGPPARDDKTGDEAARGMQTGAEDDLTKPGNQAEDR